ncbi:hypothetical protein E4Q08_14010 [Candidatus Accumulibacter phosphatis]|uniref:Lipoprotein n=1 Tax=Candidatus Accumulibacter contiguus TaxID=2954381 RepID=A0ABX1TB23_9PROT|nr:hypothetical protein [Candidatus Accumulibacter contiguus]NMQ06284.1 hypothetical protein [Candidatus Accumulibacter contiguus]
MKRSASSLWGVSAVIVFSVVGCGKKDEAKPAAAPVAAPSAEIICSLAPSQSKVVTGIAGMAGRAGATAAALAQALGLSAVPHSSGALILTGSGGYVAGTLGAAVAGPVIVGVGLVIAGSAVTVELLCAPKNHPGAVNRVEEAAAEFLRRSQLSFPGAKVDAGRMADKAVVKIRTVAGDVYEYAFGN